MENIKRLWKALGFFKLKREELVPALAYLAVVVAVNAMVIAKYAPLFTKFAKNYRWLYVTHFHISGFDPLTYSVVSSWNTDYNVYRHPLLAFFMYIPYLVNQACMWAFGINCVQFVVAAILVFCAFYSFVFLFRFCRECLGSKVTDASLVSFMLCSFAFVMAAAAAPDHFVMSMMLLLLTLYVSGRCIVSGRQMGVWKTVFLFLFTAGVSLNNGIKVFLAAWFANGRRFFRPLFLLLAIVLPSLIIWKVAREEYRYYVWPNEVVHKQKKERIAKKERAKLFKQYADTAKTKDSATIAVGVERIMAQRTRQKKAKEEKQHTSGTRTKPISQGEFMKWTDISTSRWPSIVENLFGESIQFHQRHLLEDTLRTRPMIVRYSWVANYVVEVLLVVLFLWGIWCGRRNRCLWMALSFFAFDMVIHLGLGFALDEIYIIAPHWLFVIPMALACLLTSLKGSPLIVVRTLIGALTLFLLCHNMALFVVYLWG